MSVTQLPTTVAGMRQILSYSRESNERVLGLFGQEEQVREWADQNGYMIAAYARDNDTHSKTPIAERDGLTAALNLLPEVQGFVVKRLDRIARDVTIGLEVLDRIWAAGCDLFSVLEGGLIPRGRKGREFIIEAMRFAEAESRAITSRMADARRIKASHGGYIGGLRLGRRYGVRLVRVNGALTYRPVPEEQAVITRICREHAQGVGYQRIAKMLNAEGIATATRREWSPKVVRDLVLRGPDRPALVAADRGTGKEALVVPLRRGVGA